MPVYAFDSRGRRDTLEPVYIVRDSLFIPDLAVNDEMGVKISIVDFNPGEREIIYVISEKQQEADEFIVLHAIVFPYINILWMGCIIMALGTLLAVRNRITTKKKKKTPEIGGDA